MDVVRTRTGKMVAVMLTALLAFALISGACGGGDDDDEAEAGEPTAEATSEQEAETPEGDAVVDTVEIDESFWHAGWKVTLGTATLTEESFGPRTVEIDAVFDNLGVQSATFNSQLALITGNNAYDAEGGNYDIPSNVGGGLKANGVIAIQVDEEFAFDEGTLVIGNAENNQARVPLGPGGDDLLTLEPVEIAVNGPIIVGALTIDVESIEVRADRPDWHDEIKEGYKSVIVRFRATPQAGIQIGQGVLQSDAVALKLPDGTSVSVIQDGRSGVNELLQGREGTTIRDLSVRFEVPEPLAGMFAFFVQGAYGPGGARVEGELAFEMDLEAAADPNATPRAGSTSSASVTP